MRLSQSGLPHLRVGRNSEKEHRSFLRGEPVYARWEMSVDPLGRMDILMVTRLMVIILMGTMLAVGASAGRPYTGGIPCEQRPYGCP
jgi:hypothetical protein